MKTYKEKYAKKNTEVIQNHENKQNKEHNMK